MNTVSGAPTRSKREPLACFEGIYGSSPVMRALFDEIERVAASDATALIFGESGTGKELVARALHARGARRANAFLAVNCGALSAELLEAELFGHEKGSFTGAHQQHAGFFEQATGGTLFLDEVTEMAPDTQVKLLRVIETGSFYRVGGSATIATDLRIVAATNRDPRAAAASGLLRDDLLYRLAVFPIRVPALRERGADIAGLAEHFLAEHNDRAATAKIFTREARDLLATHRWPGNVRELRNAVGRGYILGEHGVDLPAPAARMPTRAHVGRAGLDIPVGTPLADAQREIILSTLAHFYGDKPRTAAALGVSLKTLYNRLEQYDGADVQDPDRRPRIGAAL